MGPRKLDALGLESFHVVTKERVNRGHDNLRLSPIRLQSRLLRFRMFSRGPSTHDDDLLQRAVGPVLDGAWVMHFSFKLPNQLPL